MSTFALHIASECNPNPTIFAVALACAGEAALRAWNIGARGPDPRARSEHGRLTLLMVNAALALRATEPRANAHPRQCYCGNTSYIQRRPPNDCRISCNAASRATETAARFLRRLENGFAESAPPWSADCDSRPLGRRANKRRVVSFLQRLGGDHYTFHLSCREQATKSAVAK